MEFAVALALFLPVLITIIYIVLECGYCFTIKQNLDVASRNAARELATLYGIDETAATQPKATNVVLTNTRIPRFVADNQQFDEPTFVTDVDPETVTVTVHYPTNGAYGLPPFPNPDPLNLGPAFDINSSSTFRIEK